MVRHIWIKKAGKLVWVEDGPDTCPAGHQVVQRPGWGACPVCGTMGRVWNCDECVALSVDDDHRCDPDGPRGYGPRM